MIELESMPWMCQAVLSKDQQKGEKFNKDHFVVELSTLRHLMPHQLSTDPSKCIGRNEEMQAIWEASSTKVF